MFCAAGVIKTQPMQVSIRSLYGDHGNDTLYGDAGNDVMRGDGDLLFGAFEPTKST